MRCFTAVFFSEEITRVFHRNQEKCRELGIKGRTVDPTNIHLTVKFMGELDEAQREKLLLLPDHISAYPIMELKLSRLGVFPPKGKPKVLWQGLEGTDCSKLVALHKEVDAFAAEHLAVKREKRKFFPHVTLMRKPDFPKGFHKSDLASIEVEKPRTTVDALCIMRSELTPSGPIYKTLQKIPFYEKL